jgi:hypothetical protein
MGFSRPQYPQRSSRTNLLAGLITQRSQVQILSPQQKVPDQSWSPILESGGEIDHVDEKSAQCVTASAFSVSRPSGTRCVSTPLGLPRAPALHGRQHARLPLPGGTFIARAIDSKTAADVLGNSRRLLTTWCQSPTRDRMLSLRTTQTIGIASVCQLNQSTSSVVLLAPLGAQGARHFRRWRTAGYRTDSDSDCGGRALNPWGDLWVRFARYPVLAVFGSTRSCYFGPTRLMLVLQRGAMRRPCIFL